VHVIFPLRCYEWLRDFGKEMFRIKTKTISTEKFKIPAKSKQQGTEKCLKHRQNRK
jgi:hypothetical protein